MDGQQESRQKSIHFPFISMGYTAKRRYFGRMMRVLVIEDFEVLRDSIAQGLREAGFAVDAAADGETGLWHAQSNDYDVIILDLMLPRLDGLTILKRLRAGGARTHVLILTAKDTSGDRVKGLD